MYRAARGGGGGFKNYIPTPPPPPPQLSLLGQSFSNSCSNLIKQVCFGTTNKKRHLIKRFGLGGSTTWLGGASGAPGTMGRSPAEIQAIRQMESLSIPADPFVVIFLGVVLPLPHFSIFILAVYSVCVVYQCTAGKCPLSTIFVGPKARFPSLSLGSYTGQ